MFGVVLGVSRPELPMDRTIATKALLLLPLILFFHVCAQSDPSIALMEMMEQETLYSAIQDFVGKSWNGSGLYPDPCGWTPIQGVSCDLFDGLWYITVLSIGSIFDNSLECAPDAMFSPSLFQLKHLRSLTFYKCFTSPTHNPTTIPSHGWENLAGRLQSLEFRSNHGLTREIPAVLGQLVNLQSLVFSENGFTGELPQLGNLVHLKRLVLSGNQLTGQIPASLNGNLAELLILDLSRNSLSGPLPSSIGSLVSLLKLDLSNNILDGKLPMELGCLRNLTLLDLKNNSLTGGLVQPLQNLVSIQDLVLANNPMGGNLMNFEWENLRNLTTLQLSNMGLIGEIPESLTRLNKLRFLALDHNHLSSSVSPKFAAMPCLRALYLNENNLTGELGFSQVFYERMGGRFASGNNPRLCYNARVVATGHAPLGVEQCKPEQGVSIYTPGSKKKVSNGNTDENSSAMSSGFSASSVSCWFWLEILIHKVVLVFLFVVLL